MHDEAYAYVAQVLADLDWADPPEVLDIGGRDVNGTCRDLLPSNATYHVLDIRPGGNVHIVADAATWTPHHSYDLVLCTEVFEHTESWPAICATAYTALRPGGRLIVTCAGPGRGVHSGVDGEWRLLAGEHYANVGADELEAVLKEVGFVDVAAAQVGLDTQATAVRSAG